jgi:hypothetical protein
MYHFGIRMTKILCFEMLFELTICYKASGCVCEGIDLFIDISDIFADTTLFLLKY